MNSKYSPWLIWLCAVFFYCYQFVIRVAPSNMRDSLSIHFNLSASHYGIFAASWVVAYAIMQIPAGLSVDRWGIRKIIIPSLFLASLGTLLIGYADSFFILCIARFLIGIGSSTAFVAAFKVAVACFPSHITPIIVGLTGGMGVIGASIAGVPIVEAESLLGWRCTFYVLGSIGLLFSMIFYLVLKEIPQDTSSQAINIRQGFKSILKHKQFWLLGLYGFLTYTPISVLADLWGPSFIKTTYSLNSKDAAFLTSFIFYGNAAGSLIIGWLMRYFYSHRAFFATFSVLLLFLTGSIIWIPSISHLGLICGFLFLGISVAPEGMIFPIGARYFPPYYSGLSASIMNLLVTLGAVVLQPGIGFIMDFFWDGTLQNGIPVYTPYQYRLGLSFLIICMLCALIISLYMKTTSRSRIP